jgi:hypothetical protein
MLLQNMVISEDQDKAVLSLPPLRDARIPAVKFAAYGNEAVIFIQHHPVRENLFALELRGRDSKTDQHVSLFCYAILQKTKLLVSERVFYDGSMMRASDREKTNERG